MASDHWIHAGGADFGVKQTLAAWRKELWPWCDAVGRKREAVQLAHPSNVKEIGMQEVTLAAVWQGVGIELDKPPSMGKS